MSRLTRMQLERLERIAYEGPIRVASKNSAETIGASGLPSLVGRGLVRVRQEGDLKLAVITDAGAAAVAGATRQLEFG